MYLGSFYTLDIVLFVIFILAGIAGAKKGFLEEVSQKFGFVFGFLVAIIFTKPATIFVIERLSVSEWLGCAISYISLFILGYLVIKLVGSILKDAFESNITIFINGFLGFILKLFEVIVVCGAIIHFLEKQTLINTSEWFEPSVINDKILSPVINFCISLFDGVK